MEYIDGSTAGYSLICVDPDDFDFPVLIVMLTRASRSAPRAGSVTSNESAAFVGATVRGSPPESDQFAAMPHSRSFVAVEVVLTQLTGVPASAAAAVARRPQTAPPSFLPGKYFPMSRSPSVQSPIMRYFGPYRKSSR